MKTITIIRVESIISRDIVRVYGTHDNARVFSCPKFGGYVRHGTGTDGVQVRDMGTTMLQVFGGQTLAEVMAEYFGRNWESVTVEDEPFRAGDRVFAQDTGSGESGPDGRPILATIIKISVNGYAELDFDDGDTGTYDVRELTLAK